MLKSVFATVDWGFTNPGVIHVWAVDSDGRMYCVHEIYQALRTIEWWINRAREINKHFSPEVFICDPSEPGFIQQFKKAGLPAQKARNAIRPGIQALQERLPTAADGRPRFYFLATANQNPDDALRDLHKPLGLVEEVEAYVWKIAADGKPVKEEPVGVDDHALDSARYAAMHLANRHQSVSAHSIARLSPWRI